MNDETRQTEDKETNTECVFIPEQGKQRKLSAAGVAPGAVHDDKNSIVIKRSQTFSPSAAVSKNHYICRVSSFLSTNLSALVQTISYRVTLCDYLMFGQEKLTFSNFKRLTQFKHD